MIALLDSSHDVARLLEPKLHERLPQTVLEIFSAYAPLRQRLSRVIEDRVIAILVAENHDQLQQFRELTRLFADVQIVLVLPDSDTETIRLGHRLYPRFSCFRGSNLDDLVMVVARMDTNAHETGARP